MNTAEHSSSPNHLFSGNSTLLTTHELAAHDLRCSSTDMARTPTERDGAFTAFTLERHPSQDPTTPLQPAPESQSAASLSEDPELREFASLEELSVDASTHDVVVRVPSPLVSRLVGKSGAGIRELQSLSGASINMSKDGGSLRAARISGNYPETHLCAILLMQKLTPRDQSAKHTRLAALAAYFRSKCEFTVPVEHVGRVFGRGGLVLREIQDQSRAKIEIPRAVTACTGLLRSRMVREPREDAAADHAVPYADGYVPDARVPYDAYGRQLHYQYQYYSPPGQLYAAPAQHFDPYSYAVPYPTYPAYGFVPMVPQPMPLGYDPYADQLSADMSRVSLSPSLDSQDGDHQVPLALAPASPHLHAGALPFVPSPGSSPGQLFYHPHQPQMNMVPMHPGVHPGSVPVMGMHAALNMQHEAVMAVPAELIGRLIGRQGVAVKQLQSETKTRVDVIDADASTPSGTRYVRITALRPEHLQACQNQISSRIQAHFGTQ